ncbi:MAG TPA: 4-(cytidine 5'-diphospho)-2-C-methyl-D-erythritol kinase [Thermomicrobiales bacterium]|nr:4-(cytidine 5'-diphospho)-2-C-methyl-D-erythritol kinase [Thermomicrobiales bacterium]
MTAGERPVVRIAAPAKLNLGLEIVGRRPDGYHNLVTIFQAIDLCDALTLAPAAGDAIRADLPGLADERNLAVRALERIRETAGTSAGASLHIRKRIPIAAGLGGASSDAAAALLAGRAFWRSPASDADLAALALALGSDVPFFLRGGTALADGRGEQLTPLPTPASAFVIVAPHISIPAKTATLFSRLTPGDWSDGAAVRTNAARLRAGLPLDPALLGNAFARPLLAMLPALADVLALLRKAGAPNLALSGAGPTHYVVLDDSERASALATTIRNKLAGRADVVIAHPLAHPPSPRMTYL